MASKKKDKFFQFLTNMSLNLTDCMKYFANYRMTNVSDIAIFSGKIKEYELAGDEMVHDMIMELNNVFITPIEREDLLAISISMDDILDGLEHTAALFEMYSIMQMDDFMHQFIQEIGECVTEIDIAIEKLSTQKLLSIREHAINIKDIESRCDHILRASMKHLFAFEKDPIHMIQYKDVYETLEDIADCCKAVANTLEAIIMKNA